MVRRFLIVAPLAAALACAAPAFAAGTASVAALQVGLRAHGVYAGTVDGMAGERTTKAVRALQRRAGLTVDGIVGPQTRAALGARGGPMLGARPLAAGAIGWDVAALQFDLAWHGFPSGPLDGRFGERTERALRRFQSWAALAPDGLLGPATLAALRAPAPRPPFALARPVDVPITDRFGPRGTRFHTGLDFPAPTGTAVTAAAPGRVAYAGWHPGGWGYLVSIAHASGIRTLYAHLSRVDVRLGERVAAGLQIGLVGSSGSSTGPHLHFEARLRGAAIDPFPALPPD